MKSRNPIARTIWKFNKPKAYKAKKGKGTPLKRVKNTRSLFSDSDIRLAG